MATKKITLNELRSLVKQIIKENELAYSTNSNVMTTFKAIEIAIDYGHKEADKEYEIEKSKIEQTIDDRDEEQNDNYRYYNNNGYGAWLDSLQREVNEFGFGKALDKFYKLMGRYANKKEYNEIADAFPGVTR